MSPLTLLVQTLSSTPPSPYASRSPLCYASGHVVRSLYKQTRDGQTHSLSCQPLEQKCMHVRHNHKFSVLCFRAYSKLSLRVSKLSIIFIHRTTFSPGTKGSSQLRSRLSRRERNWKCSRYSAWRIEKLIACPELACIKLLNIRQWVCRSERNKHDVCERRVSSLCQLHSVSGI